MKKTIVLLLLCASVMYVFAQSTISGVNNGHYYVDLGLPSGTLWATTNIGAKDSKDNGYYFAWGETSVKRLYSWFDYKYCDEPVYGLAKYCTDPEYGPDGYVDNVKMLQSDDDAAAVNWGGSWRTPSYIFWPMCFVFRLMQSWNTKVLNNVFVVNNKNPIIYEKQSV